MAGERDVLYAATGDTAEVLPHLLGRDVGQGLLLYVVGTALHEQHLTDIQSEVASNIFRGIYGESFTPFVNRKVSGEHAKGVGFRVLRDELAILDDWHMVEEGWQQRDVFRAIAVSPGSESGKRTPIYTHTLAGDQTSQIASEDRRFSYPLKDPKTIEVAQKIYRLHSSNDESPQ